MDGDSDLDDHQHAGEWPKFQKHWYNWYISPQMMHTVPTAHREHIVPSSLRQSQEGQPAHRVVFEMGGSNTVDNAHSVESAVCVMTGHVVRREFLCLDRSNLKNWETDLIFKGLVDLSATKNTLSCYFCELCCHNKANKLLLVVLNQKAEARVKGEVSKVAHLILQWQCKICIFLNMVYNFLWEPRMYKMLT